MATKGAKKTEKVVDGVKMSKVRRTHLIAAAERAGVVAAGSGASLDTEALVHLVTAKYASLPMDDQGECGVCDGVCDAREDRCPYCTADENDEQLPEDPADAVVAEAKPKGKAQLAVVPKQAIVVDDLKPSSSLVTERELDEKIAKIQKLVGEGAAVYWEMGRAIKDLYDGQQWKLRTNAEDGKPKYKSWDAFCHHELHMSPPSAYSAMDVSAKYTVDQVRTFGSTKLSIIVRAPEEAQGELLDDAKSKTAKELTEKVQKIKKDKGHVRPARSGKAHQGAAGGAGGRKSKGDKITVAQMLGRVTVKAYKKPPTRNYDEKDLVRAKRFADVPFGRRELANGVVETITLVENGAGEWQFVIEIKQEEE